ncbi:MAG: VOC family protein [Oscillospiraceae bacterium]|nr:VOC family protein [Oscillospiraceae bacterium]
MKFNALIPELSVANIEKSKYFYIDVIGFKIEYERLEDKFAFVSLGEVQIMLEEVNDYWATAPLEHPYGRGVNFQIEVSDVEKIRDKILQNDMNLFRDISEECYRAKDKLHCCKEFLVQDPDGYLLRFSQEYVGNS